MAPPKSTASPAPGSLIRGGRNRVADSLYEWCRKNYDFGYVFTQEELLQSNIIPNKDINVLLTSVQHLVVSHLFKLHDRQGGTIGWELIAQEKAQNYQNLSRDEQMVLMIIEGAGTSGIWTKTIKWKSQLHARVLERVYKLLETKGLIKPMKHVKNPGRKMYILAGLEPSEDATGGAWFSDGQLDVVLLDVMSSLVEAHVAEQSWETVEPDDLEDQPLSPVQKRKAPADGFEDDGEERTKTVKTAEGQKGKPSKQNADRYQPFEVGYKNYPTAKTVTKHVLENKFATTMLPQNAIAQLLEVMVYDGLLVKVLRPPQGDEFPDDISANTITMYRSFKTPGELRAQRRLRGEKTSSHERIRKAAYRKEELGEIGRGGTSEVPCMQCPAFEICGDGGPVNVVTCKYFDQWYVQIREADREADIAKYPSKDKARNKVKDTGRQKETAKGKDGSLSKIEIEIDDT